MLPDLEIRAEEEGLAARLRAALAAKAMPPGALGRLEDVAVALGLAQGRADPAADPAVCLLFAGDHGIVAEGVSAWPQAVTAQMVGAFLAGGAASTVLARSVGAELRVLDAGVAGALPEDPRLVRAGIRAGTRNAAEEDALTLDEVAAALRFGAEAGQAAARGGARVVALGEMGIGNTGVAALLGAAIAGLELGALVGPGAGQDAAGMARKRAALAQAQARRPGRLAPEAALAAFGGLEVAAMAGALLGAASEGAAVLVDGFIATAAALASLTARPQAAHACLFAHRSAEPGHGALLAALGARPILEMEMRLGEGTGALAALPLLRAAAAVLTEMATLEDLGVGARAP